MVRRGVTRVVEVVLGLGVAVATTVTTLSGPALARATVAWRACGSGLECGRIAVPVDSREPDDTQVSIALIRAPAREPEQRIGSLIANFGGPGDAGTTTLPLVIRRLPATIRDRFDIVSFDPRGTGGSRAIDCIGDAATDRLLAEDPTPDDAAELAEFYDGTHSSIDVDQRCVDRYGDWLAAVGTRNVARDVDRIRVALGERRINFLGFSYGTVLGAVYAQEFGRRVRTMVLDGAVDLSASPAQELEANAAGFENALGAFLAWCRDRTTCTGDSADPGAVLRSTRDQFEQGFTAPVDDGRRAGTSTFYLALIAALYDRRDGWPALALALRTVARGDGTILQAIADSYVGRDARGRYSSLQESIGPIRCADRRDPRLSFAEYESRFHDYARRFPFFGALVASTSRGCDARLPLPDTADTLRDVRAAPDAGVLVIGTTNDPATPYAGALDLARRITGARVLTYVSTEHAAYGRGVDCIDRAVDHYFVTRALPRDGTRCEP